MAFIIGFLFVGGIVVGIFYLGSESDRWCMDEKNQGTTAS